MAERIQKQSCLISAARWFSLVCLVCLVAACATSSTESPIISADPRNPWLVQKDRMGPVALGMTIPELARALSPYFTVQPVDLALQDGNLGGYQVFDSGGQLVADLHTSQSSRNGAAPEVVRIVGRDSRIITPDGVSPGMSVHTVAARYGSPVPVASGSGENLRFTNQPSHLLFQSSSALARSSGGFDRGGEVLPAALSPLSVIDGIGVGR